MRPTEKDKYQLYIDSVQDIGGLLGFVNSICGDKMKDKKNPPVLREDFAGTGINAYHWRLDAPLDSYAIAVDIDPEPIEWGKKEFGDEDRGDDVHFYNEDSLLLDKPSDITLCLNSSIFSIHSRDRLSTYFNRVYERLNKDGVFIFEIYGGPSALTTGKDEVPIGIDEFTFVWEQRNVNTLTNRSENYISFRFPNGQQMRDAFSYDHRVWTLPELMDIIGETDFKDTEVYVNRNFEEGKEPDSLVPEALNVHSDFYPVTDFYEHDSFEAYIVCYK